MLGWLYRTLIGHFGCNHKWEVLDSSVVTNEARTRNLFVRYHMQCKHCGDIKSIDCK